MTANPGFARPLAALGLLAMLGAVPAYAADAVMEEPPAPATMEEAPLNTWSGPYAGVSLGYNFSGNTTTPTTDIDTDGFVGGVFGGYNAQSGMFVYGLEGDIGYSDSNGANALTESSTSSVDGSLRARMGVAVTDDVLLYATGGGAGQSLKLSDPAGSDRNTMLGWTAGGGVDVKITEQVFGRVEYRYTDFSSSDFNTGSGTQSIDSNENRVSFGVGMKF